MEHTHEIHTHAVGKHPQQFLGKEWSGTWEKLQTGAVGFHSQWPHRLSLVGLPTESHLSGGSACWVLVITCGILPRQLSAPTPVVFIRSYQVSGAWPLYSNDTTLFYKCVLCVHIRIWSQVWQCVLLIPSLRGTRELKASLIYIASSRPARSTQWDPISKEMY